METWESLTQKQQDILRAFLEFGREFGYYPSHRELAGRLLKSTTNMSDTISSLTRKGWVHRIPRRKTRKYGLTSTALEHFGEPKDALAIWRDSIRNQGYLFAPETVRTKPGSQELFDLQRPRRPRGRPRKDSAL